MEAAQLRLDEPVDIREQGGEIVIKPLRSGNVELATLLQGITPENVHAGADFGPPVGKEAL